MIAFVDDEQRLVGAYLDELKAAGLEVHSYGSLDRASEFFQKSARQVELLILDVMAPPGSAFKNVDTREGLESGLRFYEHVRLLRPDLPVVVLTNSPDPKVEQKFASEKTCWFLRKSQCLPFELANLIKKILADPRHESQR